MTRNTINDIRQKKNNEKIVAVAAYTYPVANLIDEFCDIILVGDSLGMTIYGHKNTLDVTLDMMINHAQAVVNATEKSFIMVDLPFGSYEKSKEQALESAEAVINKTGCDAIKLEVTTNLLETIKYLSENNINVVAHIGLIPQHIERLGGFKIQGKSSEDSEYLKNLAQKCQEFGASILVIEGVIENIAKNISQNLEIPTIGIGASPLCDGQILVIDDIVGIDQEYSPKFVKKYDNLSENIKNSMKKFSNEVKNGKFPTKDHCFF